MGAARRTALPHRTMKGACEMAIQRVELGLTDVSTDVGTEASGGCCGGGSCGCGSASSEAAEAPTASAQTTTVRVDGMTCGHCVSAVKDEVGQISGVEQVGVDLVAGGSSTVTIRSASPLSPADIAAAIDEAGYTIAA